MSDSYSYKGSGTNSQVNHSRIDSVSNSYLHFTDRAITGAAATMEVLQATRTRIIIATVSIFPSSPRKKRSLMAHASFTHLLIGNGSYYYSNPNGSTYYNSGTGASTYTAPSGGSQTSGGGGGQGKSSGK